MPRGTAGRIGLFSVVFTVLTACAPPQPSCREPATLPVVDAFSATASQMEAMHDRVVKYRDANDAYQGCLVKAINAYVRNPPFSRKYFSWIYDDHYVETLELRKHASQQAKEDVVGKFNDAVKAYNDLHPDE
jgi:hypothetical protein